MIQTVEEKSARIFRFDNLKALLILLVVLGHFIETYIGKSHALKSFWIFIYSFHMPLFLFISGLMHKGYQTDSKLNRIRVCSMLLCGYLMKIVIGLVRMALAGGKTMPFQLLSGSGAPWFVMALAAYELIVYFTRGMRPEIIFAAAVLLSIFVGYDKSIGDYLTLSRIVVFSPFYLLGYYLKPADVNTWIKKFYLKPLAALFISIYAAICVIDLSHIYQYRGLFTGRNSFATVAEKLSNVNFTSRIFTMLVAAILGFAVLAIVPDKKVRFISEAGQKTLQVYFWHMPILYIVRSFGGYDRLCALCGKSVGGIVYILLITGLTVFLTLSFFSHPTTELLKIGQPNVPKLKPNVKAQTPQQASTVQYILDVRNVSIRYKNGDFKDIGLKEYVMRRLKRDYHVNEFWADREISFSLEKGDMLGIIGTNGAGKSTLLKVVSGIMEPTKGTVKRNGTIAALLELGSGFDKDLTVRENTYLRGAMLGYTREFMDKTYEHIIEFAELQEFQDRPFKQLSSGMKSRLAFSIASLVHPDILILDEVLSVGDGAFRKKSENKMREIIADGTTTILVTHSISQVREMCNKVLWLHKGKQIEFGDNVQEICMRYEQFLKSQ